MATDATELKALNKTVTEAVNILKLYVGNSAQLKAKTQKEQDIIDSWLNVVDLAEENEKRQRAFTERQRDENGKFLKKQDNQAKKFLGIASSIKGLFSSAAIGLKTSISTLVGGITKHLSNFFQNLKSQFLGLFGEESEWFSVLASIRDSITGFAGSIIGWIWKKTPGWAKKMNSYLQGMYALQIKQMKMDFLDAGGDKKKGMGITGLLGAMVFAIGAAIGAFMHRYFALITKLPIFGRVAEMFTKLESIPFLGKLIKAVKFGFKWLGWPLTLLLGVIDFIRGYSESEGETTWEKIKDGLWSAFKGFIELPIKFITWATEKVLGFFGIDFDGKEAADKIMGIAKKGFYMIFEGWGLIFEQIANATEWVGNFVKPYVAKLVSILDPIVTSIIDFFKTFWNNALSFLKSKIPSFLPSEWVDKLKMGKEPKPTKTEPVEYDIRGTNAYIQFKKREQERLQQQAIADNLKKINETTKEGNNKTGKAINNLAAIQNNNSGGQGDVRQVPDELDNALMGINNHNGAME